MEQKKLSQLTQTKYVIKTTVTLHGQSDDGRIRIKMNGCKHLVVGKLYERHISKDSKGVIKKFLRLVGATPNYVASQIDKSVNAICPITGKIYRVTGTFKKIDTKNPIESLQNAKYETTTNLNLSSASIDQKKSILVESNASKKKTFVLDLEVIAAQRLAGLDPDLRMSFITSYLGESKATLYRKMGKGFPLPIKRGKGSFWPMSSIEAYRNGQQLH